MKRALAERAKQSLPQLHHSSSSNGVSHHHHGPQHSAASPRQSPRSTSPVSSSPEDETQNQPPLKLPRIQVPSALPAHSQHAQVLSSNGLSAPPPTPANPGAGRQASAGTATVPHSLTNSNSNKGPAAPSTVISNADATSSMQPPPTSPKPPQQRSSAISHHKRARVEQEGKDESSAFYLKHQNRALSTELRSLQFRVQQLEQERNLRRQHCVDATAAVQAIRQAWMGLEAAILMTRGGDDLQNDNAALPRPPRLAESDPTSTVNDDGVLLEHTLQLSQALAALGQMEENGTAASAAAAQTQEQQSLSAGKDDGEAGQAEAGQAAARLSRAIQTRVQTLQKWLLETVLAGHEMSSDPNTSTVAAAAALAEQKASWQAQMQDLEAQVAELQHVRQHVTTRERRVRRNVYRLGAGMLSLDQVLQALEVDNDDEIDCALDDARLRHQVAQEAAQQGISNSRSNGSAPNDVGNDATGEDGAAGTLSVSSAQVQALQSRVHDLEQHVANRESTIEDLVQQLHEKEMSINKLRVKEISGEERKRLDDFGPTQQRLEAAQSELTDLRSQLEQTRQLWSEALGNEKAIRKAMAEAEKKHAEQWAEVHGDGTVPPGDDAAKQIAELEHKLHQALENVRQAESTRENLSDALSMNETLQQKIQDLKAKLVAMQQQQAQQAKEKAVEAASATPQCDVKESSSRSAAKDDGANKSSDSSAKAADPNATREKYEKLHREYKKVRKDLGAAMQSKENAKAKLEKLEKERDGLFESNARLMKQISEKDDVNAKSLNTILNQKLATEKLVAEREALEEQAKSADQVAMAARLAAKAKERLAEETAKEVSSLQQQVSDLQAERDGISSELSRLRNECSDVNGKHASVYTEVANARERCNELVVESESKSAEIRQLMDQISSAQQQARDAQTQLDRMTAAAASSSDGNTAASAFTVEQLNTQVTVLKSRLACPVCHYRDKECIIMRCRHMHCKPCVEERIANRSRMCPTCSVKFAENDVQDVFGL